MKKSQEVAIKNNEDKIILPEIIKSEINLLVLPFFALERKNKKLEIEVEGRGKVPGTKTFWNVSANPKYGYPGPFDRKVHKAIEQIISEILREKKIIENPIPLGSLFGLCKKMQISEYSGKNYRRVKEALEKIQMTGIKSVGTFYAKGKKRWIEDIFHLYDRVVFKGKELPNSEIADDNYLFLGSWYLQNLNSRYTKPIDYTYWRNLKSKIASRLYEILGVKFYGVRNKEGCHICYKYSNLRQLLPVTHQEYISLAKQQLNPGNDELKDTGFISEYRWEKNGNDNWLISYWPGERAKEEIRRAETKNINNRTGEYLPGPKRGLENFSQEQNDLIDKLVELNISRVTAENLIINYDQQFIEKWLEAIHYAKAEDKAAYLVKAIRENWRVPEGYLKKEEDVRERKEQEKIRITREKQREEENRRGQEENERLERIYNSLDPLQQEKIMQEAENKLPDFWKEQLNKERIKGEASKLARIALEEKRREIIKEWIDSGRIKDVNSK
jgi:hypothetical protein